MDNPHKNDQFTVLSSSKPHDPAENRDYSPGKIHAQTKMPSNDHPNREAIRAQISQANNGKIVYTSHEIGSARGNEAKVIFDQIQNDEAVVR